MQDSGTRTRLPLGSALALTVFVALAGTSAQGQTERTPAPISPTPVKAMTLMTAVVPSSDLEKSIAFYTLGLGMTAARGANPREVVLALPGGGSNLMLLKNADGPNAPRPGSSRVILQVSDMKALAARLHGAGYAIKGEIREMPQYHLSVAQLEDPDGNALELIQRGG